MTRLMSPPKPKKTSAVEFKVHDLSLAEWGRKEIMLAEQEMPGLMAVRARICRQETLGRPAHHRARCT